ncbi:Uncharacterized protein FWK35_00003373 [Aphis craccivora]|uniref:Cilia- and flagella-associated protein 206 n=1 Tax=Aphis craccivora TaxID=307492 RepID=A0A6G0Z508_APHCR|nr:Uncharacterized protein FWK35_00003373 [Aphis craccivora]
MLPREEHIRKVIKGCLERGVQVSEELAYFKCWLLNPSVKNLQKQPLKIAMDNIINQCIQRLSVNEENNQKIRPLLNDILDNIDHAGNTMSINNQNIIQYIILSNYMGDPTSPIFIQEISDALNSVLNQTKLSEFKNQLSSLKINQLKEISNLVCGIWLYNMDCKNIKEDTLDMIDTLPNAVDLLLQNIEQEMRGSFKKVTMITSWIFQYYKVYSDILAPIFVIRINLATVTLKKLNDNKIALVFYLQHQKNLETIKNDLNKLKIELYALLNKFNTTLKKIKNIKNTNDFDDDTICVELRNISIIWSDIRGIMNYLSTTCSLIYTMKQMTNDLINTSEDFDSTMIMNTTPTNNEKMYTIIETYPLHPMCEWHPPTASADNERNFFADGYCVVMIVETEGTLIKHDKSLGVIQYSDEWFGFSSIQAALHFVKSKTHLLSFFHLYEQMTETQQNPNKIISEKEKYKDAQVQTALYIHDKNSISNITNNSKEIKQCMKKNKKIIDTIDKTLKVTTRSAQTLDVYKSVQVQTKLCDVGSNTMSEKATNTNESVPQSSIRFKNMPYAGVEFYDINSLVCSTTTIRSTNNCQTKFKD